MRRTAIASILLTLVITLTSCGSGKGAASTGSVPLNNTETSPTTKESVSEIDNVMKSVETAVDSLEDAVDINLSNLE